MNLIKEHYNFVLRQYPIIIDLTKMTVTKESFPNDAFQLDAPCLENFLEGILFWSQHTPTSPALFFPRTPDSHCMEIIQWNEFKVS